MSDFNDLPIEDRAQRMKALAIEALVAWGVTDCAPELLKLRENGVFKVFMPNGDPAVIRVHRAGYHSDAELNSELQWMRALADAGIAAPVVYPTLAGEDFIVFKIDAVPEPRQVDVLSWINGEAFGSLDGGLDKAIARPAAEFAALGRLAARMHNHSAGWSPPAGFTRHAWHVDGLTGEQPFWGRFWELELLTPGQKKLMLVARDAARKDLIAFGQDPEVYGLIHADLLPDNVLVDGASVKPIDFDDAGYGWHLFDLSTITMYFIGHERFEMARDAVVAGYREVRALDDEALSHMPLFYLVRGFTYLGWIHTRSETDTAKEIAPLVIPLVCRLAEDYLAGKSA